MIYFDSDAFRNVGIAFSESALPDDLRRHIVISPISAAEVMSQLITQEGDRVLAAIHAMRNWLPTDRATILDWPTGFVAENVFGVPYADEAYEHVGDALNACLLAETAEQLREPATELRALLDSAKDAQAGFDQEFVKRFRAEPVPQVQLPNAFARAMAERTGAQLRDGQEAGVLEQLSAYFEYQTEILTRAVANEKYNFFAHLDRLLDAEQLVYLSDSRLHFVTCDAGSLRIVMRSPQRTRVHLASVEQMRDTQHATAFIREVAGLQARV